MAESKTAQSVAAALTNPASSGARHAQMKSVILSLIEIGLSSHAIFAQFRGMYGSEVLDSEIEAIIAWGLRRARKRFAIQTQILRPSVALTQTQATTAALSWLNGFEIDEASLWDASQIRPADDEDPSRDLILALEHLYRAHEPVCINTRYHVAPKKEGQEKVTIIGPGETRTAAEWVKEIKANGTPQSRAGAWIRLNPLRCIHGSGAGGAHCDADVASWRYLLLESDLLSPELALNVYGKLALPIVAIIDSVGRGPHAWVTVNAQSPEEYAQKAKFIFERLVTIGFDPSNSNPSRYGRLPGAQRIIGVRQVTDCFQRLLYLAPHLKPKAIFS